MWWKLLHEDKISRSHESSSAIRQFCDHRVPVVHPETLSDKSPTDDPENSNVWSNDISFDSEGPMTPDEEIYDEVTDRVLRNIEGHDDLGSKMTQMNIDFSSF